MRVLVTGIDGYIGAVLGPKLMERGFEVVGIDCGFYRDGWFYNDHRPRPLTLSKDVRQIAATDVHGFEAVVHLAELSNDPLGEFSERTTYEITTSARLRWRGLASRPGSPGLFILPHAAFMVRPTTEASATSDRRRIPKPPMQSAKC